MLESALRYAARGWRVLPCRGCGKRPLTAQGCKAATTDAAQIQEWWKRWPQANIGIATGKASGIVVLDIDLKNDGDGSLADLEAAHEPLPATIEVVTGSGGRHVWFAHPGHPVANSAGKIGAGLDIRGDGGYVIAPPSIHETGRRYEWEVVHHPDDSPLAEIPSWLLSIIQNASSTETIISPDEPILEGSRNDTLFRLACAMRRYGTSEPAIHAALAITNQERCQPPLAGHEIAHIAKSGSRYAPDEGRQTMANGNKVGALWEYFNADGMPYFSGYIDLGILGRAKIVVFQNSYKEGNQPDYNILLSKPKEDAPAVQTFDADEGGEDDTIPF